MRVVIRHSAMALAIFHSSAAFGTDAYQGLFDLSLQQLNQLQINDVVTHAAKWESNSLDLPFSISFITPYDYYTPFISSIRDIDAMDSSLTITEYNDVTPQFYIRGIGSNSSGAGDDPSVALLIDGVNIARPGFYNLSLFDLKRVEVIKGPQSSLYGKGVIGGAVNILPNQPDSHSYSHVMAEAQDRGWRLQGIINTAINDSLSNRLSITAQESDGYVENVTTNEDLGGKDSYALRQQLLWEGDHKKAHVLFEYQSANVNGPAQAFIGDEPQGFGAIAPYANQYDKVTLPSDNFSHVDFGYLHVNFEQTTDAGKWVSTTAINQGNYDFKLNVTPIDFLATTNSADEKAWQASQELRFERTRGDLHWSAGIYISREHVEREEQLNLVGLTNLLGFGGTISEAVPGFTDLNADHDVLNGALFWQGQWDFHDDWFVNVGLRHDHVRKDFDLQVSGGDIFGITLLNAEEFHVTTDRSWKQFSHSLSLGHYLSKDHLVYVRNALGFKAGNFNSVAFSPDSASASSKPEIANSYEIGMKGFYFDHQLKFNIALFMTEYEDLQVYVLSDSEANAPEADIFGVEWEAKAKVLSGLELSVSHTYLDTEFGDFIAPRGIDLGGKDLTRSPEHSTTIGISYSWDDQSDNHYWLEWRTSYTDSYFISPESDPGTVVDSYSVSNLSLIFKPSNSTIQYSAWIKNLFDEEYALHSIDQSVLLYASNGAAKNVAPPRTMGVLVSWTP